MFLTLVSGAPCVLLKGLKCPPAALQPSLRSPNWWTWNPWTPGVSPSTSPVKLDFMLYFTKVAQIWHSLSGPRSWPDFNLPSNNSLETVPSYLHYLRFLSPFQNDQNYKLQSLLHIWHILLLISEIFFLYKTSYGICIEISWQENGLDVNSWLATIHKHKLLPHLTNVCIMAVQTSTVRQHLPDASYHRISSNHNNQDRRGAVRCYTRAIKRKIDS